MELLIIVAAIGLLAYGFMKSQTSGGLVAVPAAAAPTGPSAIQKAGAVAGIAGTAAAAASAIPSAAAAAAAPAAAILAAPTLPAAALASGIALTTPASAAAMAATAPALSLPTALPEGLVSAIPLGGLPAAPALATALAAPELALPAALPAGLVSAIPLGGLPAAPALATALAAPELALPTALPAGLVSAVPLGGLPAAPAAAGAEVASGGGILASPAIAVAGGIALGVAVPLLILRALGVNVFSSAPSAAEVKNVEDVWIKARMDASLQGSVPWIFNYIVSDAQKALSSNMDNNIILTSVQTSAGYLDDAYKKVSADLTNYANSTPQFQYLFESWRKTTQAQIDSLYKSAFTKMQTAVAQAQTLVDAYAQASLHWLTELTPAYIKSRPWMAQYLPLALSYGLLPAPVSEYGNLWPGTA